MINYREINFNDLGGFFILSATRNIEASLWWRSSYVSSSVWIFVLIADLEERHFVKMTPDRTIEIQGTPTPKRVRHSSS